jgi:glycosyltransferase involved in cell wall biosynthesis
MALPLFSLVVCTIGRTTPLARLLGSLSRQTLKAFEVIIVDQNPDGLLDLTIEPFKTKLAIRHVRAEKGLSKSRNLGIRISSGDCLSFPDDDCWYGPDVLAQVAQQLEVRPGHDLLLGRTVDQHGRPSLSRSRETSGPITKANVWVSGNSSTLFIRRHVIDVIGGFDEELGVGAKTIFQSGEETDFILRALEHKLTAFYDSTLLIYHPKIDMDVATLLSRARNYSAGFGYVLRKHRYGRLYLYYRITRSAGRAILALLMLNLAQAKYRAAWAAGTLKGYFAKSW